MCALKVHATVVSRPTPERGILDSGSKSLSSDLHGLDGYGYICEYPDAKIYTLSEDHGHVDFSACVHKPEIGERVTVIPNHCCTVTSLFDEVVGVRGDQVEVFWKVAARCAVR
jgi:D-serine deaminase-like pyridoxal phosphate-dependent protein